MHMIAGQYLYTFNKWAVSLLENQNIMAVIPPAENSESNLCETFETENERSRVLLSVFAYPVLFRMRFKLPKDYDFTYFSDKEKMGFKVNSTADGSFVMPEAPFSLLDKMDSLKTKGWKRQLIDFSKTKVTKGEIRGLLNLLQSHGYLEGSSRFNWKDGFYSPEKIEAYQAANARRQAEEEQGIKVRRPRYGKSGKGKSGFPKRR